MDVMTIFVEHILKTQFEDLPPETIAATKQSIVDTVGVILAGSSEKGPHFLMEQIREWGGRPESTVAVYGDKVPAHLAALVNASMARALEIADVYDGFPLHPSSSTIPVALAMAERQGNINGKELIAAIAVGQDMIVRLALATKIGPIQSGRYNLFKIFPPTGTAGKLLGLNEEQLCNAMGIAFTQMVGDGQSALDGAMTHYIQQGIVAQSAIESVLLAQKGITGGRNILQGRYGFYNAYEPEPNIEALTQNLGQAFLGSEISVKLYSSCRATHEAVDLALELRDEENIDPGLIDKVSVRVNEPVYNLTCLDRKPNPQTSVEAQFSLPFCVAAAFVTGDVFVEELSEAKFMDPAIIGLAERVKPEIDPQRQNELVVGSTLMEVRLENGRVLSRETQYPRGNPKNPVSLDDCLNKFHKCLAYAARPFPSKSIDQITSHLLNIDESDDVGKLARLLSPDT
jgi:2-methylcitrate dehydratase PrpD